MKHQLNKRKRVIVFSYEGKNNKTEKLYFLHFKPFNDDFIIKSFSSGATDPKNMIASTKRKRDIFDYHKDEDLTFIFIDGDDDPEKLKLVNEIRARLSKNNKDICIVLSNPCFEVWFLNHFIKFGNSQTNDQLLHTLGKYIPNYDKAMDVYHKLKPHSARGLKNCTQQLQLNRDNPKSEVPRLFCDNIIIDKV